MKELIDQMFGLMFLSIAIAGNLVIWGLFIGFAKMTWEYLRSKV